MDKKIEIKIQQNHLFYDVPAAFGVLAFVVCCIYFLFDLSLLTLLLIILSGALSAFFVYLAWLPTVVWSDGEKLHWKHFFAEHNIYLTEITAVNCEPYNVYSRSGAYQRVSLTLITGSGTGEIRFNDSVDAGDLLDEKLGKKKAEIPLLQLNNYLREHCREQ